MREDEIPEIDLKKMVNEGKQEVLDERTESIKKNMEKIKHKIVIISGKGGVGKTTVAVNLAVSLASVGLSVGVLDVDITGQMVIKMLGVSPELKPTVDFEAKKFYPIVGPLNIKVMSMAFLTLDPDEPVIWRGPMKMSAVRQFLGDAELGRTRLLNLRLTARNFGRNFRHFTVNSRRKYSCCIHSSRSSSFKRKKDHKNGPINGKECSGNCRKYVRV